MTRIIPTILTVWLIVAAANTARGQNNSVGARDALPADAKPFDFHGLHGDEFSMLHVAGSARRGRQVENFDFDWRFLLGDPSEAKNPTFDDGDWRTITLPHDFSVEQDFIDSPELADNAFLPGGTGWYRKSFHVHESRAGKKFFIAFDGVFHCSDVWLNGHHLGFRPFGYVSFEYDLTPYLAVGGRNVIAVRVDHSRQPTSRWYSGSGIYRHVRLVSTDPVHIDRCGIRITTPDITTSEATAKITTRVKNDGATDRRIVLSTEILSPRGQKAGAATRKLTVGAGKVETFVQEIKVAEPMLWDIDNPALYTAVTRIASGGDEDDVETVFGFRTLTWDSRKGFFLNGRNMKLKGVNLHHDGGIAVGAAVPERLWEMRLTRLKDLGVNFIRTSHNPVAPEFLDLCDRLGLMVMGEAFDKWKQGYYAEFFDEWWKADLQSMLERDANHPSVILWSVGNEVGDDQKTVEGAERLEMLVNFVHEFEPARKVTAGMYPSERDHNLHGFADKLDVAGHNYNEPFYAADKAKYPHRIILGTENYLYYRGLCADGMDFDAGRHSWLDVVENDWVTGWTLWPGIDYLGETNRFDLKGWPTGLLDASSREKPIAGLYRAFWKPEPQLELAVLDDALDVEPGMLNWSAPKMAKHWNFPHYKKRIIRVRTFSNCDSVALRVNSRSLGKRAIADGRNCTIEWDVPYVEGVLSATGYVGGREVVVRELRTAGKPAEIALVPVSPTVRADGSDAAIVELYLKDDKGVTVQNDDRLVSFSVVGGELLGIDNGDLRIVKRADNAIVTYFGRCLLVVRAPRRAGEIIVTATSDELPAQTLRVACESNVRPYSAENPSKALLTHQEQDCITSNLDYAASGGGSTAREIFPACPSLPRPDELELVISSVSN